MCFLSCSAWLKSADIYDKVEHKDKFRTKNHSTKFGEAIKQADEAVENERQQQVNVPQTTSAKRSHDEKVTVQMEQPKKEMNEKEEEMRKLGESSEVMGKSVTVDRNM